MAGCRRRPAARRDRENFCGVKPCISFPAKKPVNVLGRHLRSPYTTCRRLLLRRAPVRARLGSRMLPGFGRPRCSSEGQQLPGRPRIRWLAARPPTHSVLERCPAASSSSFQQPPPPVARVAQKHPVPRSVGGAGDAGATPSPTRLGRGMIPVGRASDTTT